MPQYSYICNNCQREYDYLHLGSNDRIPQCPHCSSSSAEKQIPKDTGFSLKGGGWHNDVYNKSGRRDKKR